MSRPAYLRFTEDELRARSRCGLCGMVTRHPAEFHPHLYCVLFMAGYPHPEEYLRANGWSRDGMPPADPGLTRGAA